MSYLDFPRLYFSGQFQADPSTVNNDPYYYQNETFVPEDQLPQTPTEPAPNRGWWNPMGSGDWSFRNCIVRRVEYRDGTFCDDPNVDPIVGMELNGANNRVKGKLVDLDPELQEVSEIWGFKLHLGNGDDTVFQGGYKVTGLADLWFTRALFGGDMGASAYYQSIIKAHLTKDGSGLESRFLQELCQTTDSEIDLSIRFTVDGYDQQLDSPNFTWGRVVGAIGLQESGQPKHFIGGRLLRPLHPEYLRGIGVTPDSKVVNYAPAQIVDSESKKWLLIDLSNSLPCTEAGGPLENLGALWVALILSGGQNYKLIDSINYLADGWYEDRAGIYSLELNKENSDIANTPIAIVVPKSAGSKNASVDASEVEILWEERQDGSFARTDDFVFRLNPGDKTETELYAFKFGKPSANQEFDLSFDKYFIKGYVQQAPTMIPGPKVGEPESALTFKQTVTTDSNGKAKIVLTGADPLIGGDPARGYIDGQVYSVRYAWKGVDPPQEDPNGPPNGMYCANYLVNTLVWNDYKCKGAKPTWVDDVQPIFQQYANLYPVMKPIVDLGDFYSVIGRLDMLKLVFNLDPRQPNYMPVTRDLSGSKRDMIKTWLQDPLYAADLEIKTVEDLQNALQTAVELEHATIPPYLCGLYSIKPGCNVEVANLIRSVVLEEMLHMSLACNLLNAIGGSPAINKPKFVPEYPTGLPGNLRPDLTVGLKKCSVAQIRNVFMSIEEPDVTLEPTEGDGTEATQSVRQHHMRTIGWFYKKIEKGLDSLHQQLGDKLFSGDSDRQLKEWYDAGQYGVTRGRMIAVTDIKSARRAIREICRQGEGASHINPADGYNELAHFYKFEEIVRGRSIVLQPDAYSFSGAEISLDPDGVYPMVDNPSTASLPPGSQAELLSEQFNEGYANMLDVLHRTFNGHPDALKNGIGQMFALSVLARKLMSTQISGTSKNAGPSFEMPSGS